MGREKLYAIQPALQKRCFVVVGAGVAGMEAARVLNMRGHQVTVLESSSRAGGVLHIAGAPSFKEDDLQLVAWYVRTLAQLGVDMRYNTMADAALLATLPHDGVIVATGSTPRILSLAGHNQLYKAEDILSGAHQPGHAVAVIGGGLVGCELALDLAQKGHDVSIVESLPAVLSAGAAIPHMNKTMLLDLLRHHQVRLVEGVAVQSVEGGVIHYQKDGVAATLTADTVAYAIGYRPEQRLYQAIQLEESEIYLLGDASRPRNIMCAIWDAYELANNL